MRKSRGAKNSKLCYNVDSKQIKERVKHLKNSQAQLDNLSYRILRTKQRRSSVSSTWSARRIPRPAFDSRIRNLPTAHVLPVVPDKRYRLAAVTGLAQICNEDFQRLSGSSRIPDAGEQPVLIGFGQWSAGDIPADNLLKHILIGFLHFIH